MYRYFPGKSPMQMRLEYQRSLNPRPKREPPPRPVDPAKRPVLHSDTGVQVDPAAEWLAHLAAGRIEVK